ncbi:MAG: sirohydrochlorin cobaltochelatase [Fusicatenibacter saccharivorans]|uniref:Sirohydrochlorin cobaltochelatase n=1 Tax=Fusicatenibacter saccharivorans TaxID=1150298 RepID=A0A938ZEV9_9FIRM|nr:sirohydrochlorin cobaltochelatase [Fusicatenibacter saccharivorans]
MKKKLVVALISAAMVTSMLGACGSSNTSSSSASSTAASSVSASSASEEDTTAASSSVSASSASEEVSADADQEAADKVAALIDAIYVQERNDNTDEQCKEAKEAWDALTDAQKELVEGENADPDYFGRDTGDASKDDPLNGDEIGENELLVVSFGTSFNDSRAEDIGGVEKALQAAYPDWSVRRAFTAQIIINHVQARDDEKIDNVDQALERAVSNGVKKLIIQPTHLMHGAEYDELKEAVDSYKDKFESVTIAEPLLGEVGSDATVINEDKQAVAEAITAQAVKSANYDSLDAAAEDGTAFVFMGHGTSHTANVTYSQMQTQMDTLGYKNVFIGTVEGKPEETACENVIEAVKAAGYKKVILRPLMVVAGDHANNDMAGEDEDSWKSQFEASGAFDEIDTQIEGLGRIDAVEQLYVQHTKAAMDGNGVQDDAE